MIAEVELGDDVCGLIVLFGRNLDPPFPVDTPSDFLLVETSADLDQVIGRKAATGEEIGRAHV